MVNLDSWRCIPKRTPWIELADWSIKCDSMKQKQTLIVSRGILRRIDFWILYYASRLSSKRATKIYYYAPHLRWFTWEWMRRATFAFAFYAAIFCFLNNNKENKRWSWNKNVSFGVELKTLRCMLIGFGVNL